MKKEVKVVILGLGNRGKNYGGHLAALPNVKIVAICDKYQAKIDKVKKACPIAAKIASPKRPSSLEKFGSK